MRAFLKWVAGGFLVAAVLFATALGAAIHKEANCRDLEFDMKILSTCATSDGCMYTYTDMHALIDRMVDCGS